MTDHVIEFAEGVVEIEDAGGGQPQIRKFQLGAELLAHLDLPGREIDADELAIRKGLRQGEQVAAGAAAQFQHSAALDPRGSIPASVASVARQSGCVEYRGRVW